jgi:hypothetical protein
MYGLCDFICWLELNVGITHYPKYDSSMFEDDKELE